MFTLELEQIEGIGKATADRLREAGFANVEFFGFTSIASSGQLSVLLSSLSLFFSAVRWTAGLKSDRCRCVSRCDGEQ